MKTRHLLNLPMLCMALILHHSTQSQSLQWVTVAGGDSSQCAREIQVDDQGNVYTLGQFAGTVDLDPGPGSLAATSFDGEDIYLQKLDPSGNLLWAVTFGGAWLQDGTGMALDSAGNIYLTGGFDQTVDFDPGPGTSFRVSAGDADVFLLKLAPNSQFQWVKTIGGQLNDFGEGIALDPWGNICLIGNFEGTVDFDPGFGTENLTAADSHDIFIAKFSPSGNLNWAGSFPGNRDVNFVRYEIVADDSGNVYATGDFVGDTDFDPGPVSNLLVNQGLNDIFLLKLDSTGQLLWANSYGSPGEDAAFAIGIDDNHQINFGGGFSDSLDMGGPNQILVSQGDADGFAAQVSPNGVVAWAAGFGGTGFDLVKCLSVEATGAVLVAGQFQNTMVLPNTTLVSQGDDDVFLIRRSSSGQYETGSSIGGPEEVTAEDIAIDNNGFMHLAGSFRGTADFDFFMGGNFLSSAGELDAYTLKSDILLSLDQSQSPLRADVYPNPTANLVNVHLEQGLNEGKWSLCGLFGEPLAQSKFEQGLFQVDLSAFPRGMYLLQVQTESRSTSLKVIRQ